MRPLLDLIAFIVLAGIFEGALAEREARVIEEAHKRAAEQHARVYAMFARCMSEPTVITDNGKPVAACYPRRK